MTKRDTFFTREEYMQLITGACSTSRPDITDNRPLVTLPPAILAPKRLYTGKQVPQDTFCCFLPLSKVAAEASCAAIGSVVTVLKQEYGFQEEKPISRLALLLHLVLRQTCVAREECLLCCAA